MCRIFLAALAAHFVQIAAALQMYHSQDTSPDGSILTNSESSRSPLLGREHDLLDDHHERLNGENPGVRLRQSSSVTNTDADSSNYSTTTFDTIPTPILNSTPDGSAREYTRLPDTTGKSGSGSSCSSSDEGSGKYYNLFAKMNRRGRVRGGEAEPDKPAGCLKSCLPWLYTI